MVKTVRLEDSTHESLVAVKGILTVRFRRIVDFDETINYLIQKETEK